MFSIGIWITILLFCCGWNWFVNISSSQTGRVFIDIITDYISSLVLLELMALVSSLLAIACCCSTTSQSFFCRQSSTFDADIRGCQLRLRLQTGSFGRSLYFLLYKVIISFLLRRTVRLPFKQTTLRRWVSNWCFCLVWVVVCFAWYRTNCWYFKGMIFVFIALVRIVFISCVYLAVLNCLEPLL